jgi:hypothetical protein
VPHLTVSEGEPEVLAAAEAAVRRVLPLHLDATELLLLAEADDAGSCWEARATLRLGSG